MGFSDAFGHDPARKARKVSAVRIPFPAWLCRGRQLACSGLRRAFLQGCGERRIAVPAKVDDVTFEQIPANFWRDGLRLIDPEVFNRILNLAAVDQLIALVDLDRREDVEVFGVLLNRRRARLDARIEVFAVNDGRDSDFNGLDHCQSPRDDAVMA